MTRTNQPFTMLFNTATAKVLDIIFENTKHKFTLKDISKKSGLSLSVTQTTIKHLVFEKILKKHTVRKNTLYAANLSSERAIGLLEYTMASRFEDFLKDLKTPSKNI